MHPGGLTAAWVLHGMWCSLVNMAALEAGDREFESLHPDSLIQQVPNDSWNRLQYLDSVAEKMIIDGRKSACRYRPVIPLD